MPPVIRDFADADAPAFYAINAAWIADMFALEPHDEHVLRHPREVILAPGGVILVAELPGRGVIGTAALMPDGAGGWELTKMGVAAAARGTGAGAALLAASLARATAIGADPLYLLTSHACAAAIHLYEKAGSALLREHGARYARCDVAMRWPGSSGRSRRPRVDPSC